jgi:UDP-N-acetylglucosamine 2-epimerase
VRIATVVGTRPQLIKLAALQPPLRRRHEEVFVDTGQHWDDAMAGSFFRELDLPKPDVTLGVAASRSGVEQTARMLAALEPVLLDAAADAVLVIGDTNSTLAGALAGAKLGIPVAHVEAGLRSFDRRMPEEINRVVADHLAHWSFAPTPTAVANLREEGISAGVHLVGDVMQDLVARIVDDVRDPRAGPRPSGTYLFATIHRAENRDPAAVERWLALLGDVARPERPVILALHPGTRVVLDGLGLVVPANVEIVEPLGYRSSIAAQLHAAAVLTDSGGVQREAAWLGVPCLILRGTTEWVESVADSGGRTVVVGLDAAAAWGALARLAPLDDPSAAIERARSAIVAPVGAGERISAALAGEAPGLLA